MLVRYGELVASYYTTFGNNNLIIRCSGMPGLPSDKDEFGFLQKSGYDIVKPDYYGYARSGGVFTPSGCIETVLDTVKVFCGGKILDVRGNREILVNYDEIVIIGASFGGRVASMAPKFNMSIKEIVLLYPQLAPAKYGTLGLPEETTVEFWRQCKQGYDGLFRRGDNKERQEMFADEGPYIPTLHYTHLHDVSVYMGHGTADEVINYTRTRDFCRQLQSWNPIGDYHFVEYYGLGHGGICKQAILEGRVRHKSR